MCGWMGGQKEEQNRDVIVLTGYSASPLCQWWGDWQGARSSWVAIESRAHHRLDNTTMSLSVILGSSHSLLLVSTTGLLLLVKTCKPSTCHTIHQQTHCVGHTIFIGGGEGGHWATYLKKNLIKLKITCNYCFLINAYSLVIDKLAGSPMKGI